MLDLSSTMRVFHIIYIIFPRTSLLTYIRDYSKLHFYSDVLSIIRVVPTFPDLPQIMTTRLRMHVLLNAFVEMVSYCRGPDISAVFFHL